MTFPSSYNFFFLIPCSLSVTLNLAKSNKCYPSTYKTKNTRERSSLSLHSFPAQNRSFFLPRVQLDKKWMEFAVKTKSSFRVVIKSSRQFLGFSKLIWERKFLLREAYGREKVSRRKCIALECWQRQRKKF